MTEPVRGSSWLTSPRHGPLPALLLMLTVGTGLVDAVSILALGRVFVANMTGNVVFTGFALAGAPGFSLAAALVALAGFLVGAGLAGPLIGRLRHHRGRVLAVTTTAEVALLGAALAVAVVADEPFAAGPRNVLAGLAAVAMGMQNTAARDLAVPDATTTVLTMTLTGVAADLRDRNLPVLLRRLLAVAAMLLGALAGALLVLHASAAAALAAAVVLVAVVCAAAWWASRRPAPWQERAVTVRTRA